MNCKYFRYLLMQLPYNELNKEETGLLESHLKECESCRAELKDNELINTFSNLLSESIPSDKNQQQSIQNILEKINSPHSRKDVPDKLEGSVSKPDLIYHAFRMAINIAAVFLIGLFLLQQIEIKRKLENLQSKITEADKTVQQKKLPASIQDFNSLSDSQIELLIREYDELLKENSAIISYLKINYPEIYREILQKKNIDRSAFQNL